MPTHFSLLILKFFVTYKVNPYLIDNDTPSSNLYILLLLIKLVDKYQSYYHSNNG